MNTRALLASFIMTAMAAVPSLADAAKPNSEWYRNRQPEIQQAIKLINAIGICEVEAIFGVLYYKDAGCAASGLEAAAGSLANSTWVSTETLEVKNGLYESAHALRYGSKSAMPMLRVSGQALATMAQLQKVLVEFQMQQQTLAVQERVNTTTENARSIYQRTVDTFGQKYADVSRWTVDMWKSVSK